MADLIRTAAARVAGRVNHSRWLADCIWCNGAHLLRPGTPVFTCAMCGATSEVVWPPEAMCHGIVRLLMLRPDPRTRNWEPNETLLDLIEQNNLHGVGFTEALRDNPDGGLMLMATEDRIVTDRMPLPGRRQLVTLPAGG